VPKSEVRECQAVALVRISVEEVHGLAQRSWPFSAEVGGPQGRLHDLAEC
jgi:hypothetical protein